MNYSQDPLIYRLRSGKEGDEFIEIDFSLKVINNKFTLTEVPDKEYKVQVSGYNEILNLNDETPEIASNEYYVDYNIGEVYFNPSEEGKTLTGTFWGRGVVLFPTSRIYRPTGEGETIEILEDVVQSAQEATHIIEDAGDVLQDAQDATDAANTAATHATTQGDYALAKGNEANTAATNANNAKDAIEANESERQTNETAREDAETIRVANESARISNESDRDTAESTRQSNETSRSSAETSRDNAEDARVIAETARNTAETTRSDNEDSRIVSENTRLSNESARETSESDRVTAENARVSAESSRVIAESTRDSNEDDRISSESSRATAESARVDAESDRETSESTRESNETNRISAESVRVSDETAREAAEIARGNAEVARVSSEDSRVTAETARENAEDLRETSEDTRISNESDRVSAESSRVSAESGRVSAETVRQSNESTRQTQETTRQTNTAQAISDVNDKIDELDALIENTTGKLEYNSSATYYKNNFVTDNGSSYMALQTVTGVKPSSSAVEWQLMAQRGVDGTGSVSSVNGVSPDLSGNVTITASDINLPVKSGSGTNSTVQGSGTTASGPSSHAEGSNTTASALQAHAEGSNTIASNNSAHAEGIYSQASSIAAHAEGENTIASGRSSHAEGFGTVAGVTGSVTSGLDDYDGYYTHAEGSGTKAYGNSAHAEGKDSVASGKYSHSQNKGTIASGESQTAMGRFNIEDDSKAVIIGNGLDDDNRSNALTLDWDGNLSLSGEVTDGEGTTLSSLKSSIVEGQTIPSPLQRGVNVVNTDQASGASVQVKGRTLVNILGRDGGCESLTGFTYNSGAVSISTVQKRSGTSSIKLEVSDGQARARKEFTYALDATKYYLFTAWTYIESWTSGTVSLSLRQSGSTTVDSQAFANSSLIGQWQFISVKVPTGNTLGNGFRLYIGQDGAINATVYFDEIRLYEISAVDYAAIGTTITGEDIDAHFPYVGSVQHLQGVSVRKTGLNLLPPVDMWSTVHANASRVAPYELFLAATASGQPSFVNIPARGGQQYTASIGSIDGGAGWSVRVWEYKGSTYNNASQSPTPGSPKTWTTKVDTDKLRYEFTCISAGNFNFKNWMLVLGDTSNLPESFEPRIDQYTNVPTLLASNVDRSIADSYDSATGEVFRRWRQSYKLDGSLEWVFLADRTGFKSVAVVGWTDIAGALPSQTQAVSMGYDGRMINTVDYNDLATAADAVNISGDSLYICVPDVISGWTETLNPNNGIFIKALMNGWKANGNDGSVYDSWESILDGSPPIYNYVGYVVTYKAPGWDCYATLDYVLATPVVEQLEGDLGALSLAEGGNTVELLEGVIVRESVTPIPFGGSGLYYINRISAVGSELSKRAEKILAVYKGEVKQPFSTDVNVGWVVNASDAYGNERCVASIPFVDPAAEYYVDYIVLDKYAYTTNAIDATLTYQSTLGGAVAQATQDIAKIKQHEGVQDFALDYIEAKADNNKIDLDNVKEGLENILDNADLTGTPTATTPTAGDNSTRVSNTAFVQEAIAALVDSSPDALNTLNELAQALGDDPNFATTVLNKLSTKLDKSEIEVKQKSGIDLNTLVQDGRYHIFTMVNGPTGIGAECYAIVTSEDGSIVFQTILDLVNNKMHTRTYTGTWSTWSYGGDTTIWEIGVGEIDQTGHYYILTNYSDLPIAQQGYVSHIEYPEEGHGMQEYTPSNENRKFIRRKLFDYWYPWTEEQTFALTDPDGSGKGGYYGNANTLPFQAGMYSITSPNSNFPVSTTGICNVYYRGSGYYLQEFITIAITENEKDRRFTRSTVDGGTTWGPWVEMMTTANIIKSTSDPSGGKDGDIWIKYIP
ncbi:hypothetical protein [Paenibacillus sp. HB172176]|uniref:hypothetical protein n=1 Tax=Paenibacillus sp. HB172176 TaxID=2493690 RepID=UPI001980B08B|nr:hypothetical protein [Paenibacillus sp. HB172176]